MEAITVMEKFSLPHAMGHVFTKLTTLIPPHTPLRQFMIRNWRRYIFFLVHYAASEIHLTLDIWRYAPGLSSSKSALAIQSIIPVSYTHLDVYKRQTLSNM